MKSGRVLSALPASVLGIVLLAGCRATNVRVPLADRADSTTPARIDVAAAADKWRPVSEPTRPRSVATAESPKSQATDSGIARVALFQEAPDAPPAVDPSAPGASQTVPVPEYDPADLPMGVAGPVMTLAELRELALSGNPTLRQAQGLIQQAEGNWLQVGLYPNPLIAYSGSANNAPFDAHGALVQQNIVTANKLGLSREVASFDVQRARWEAQAQQMRVINEIYIRYVTVLGTQQQLATAQQLVRTAEEGVRASEQLLEGEVVSRADVLQARLQLSQTQVLLRNSRFAADAAWTQLGDVIGWPDLASRTLEGTLEDEVPEVQWDSAWQQLLASSPLLHAARARCAAADAQVRREMVQPIPDAQVMGSVGYDFVSPQFMMYGLQVGVQLPLFDKNQGNITAARGEFVAARNEIQRLELSMRDALADAFRRYESARNLVETYRQTIRPTAEENLSLAEQNYKEGEFDFLRVLTARRDLFQASIDYVAALTQLHSAAIEIQGMVLTGGLDPVVNSPTRSNNAGQTAGPQM
ncbi:MAG: TolC family protein [Planctomycetaceae bacterium]